MAAWCGHWTWAPPTYADILLQDEDTAIYVPGSSCHGGYTCYSAFEMNEPGRYQFFLQTKHQSSMAGICYRPDPNGSWGNGERSLTTWCTRDLLVVLEVELSDSAVHLTVRIAKEIDGVLVPEESSVFQNSLHLEQPLYPWVVVAGTMHNAYLCARFQELIEWQPAMHSRAPRPFQALVQLLFLLRNDNSTVMSALPRELMYLLIDALWRDWLRGLKAPAPPVLPDEPEPKCFREEEPL